MHKITINSILNTLDHVPVAGHENWNRMLAVYQLLEEEAKKAEEGTRDDHQNEQE